MNRFLWPLALALLFPGALTLLSLIPQASGFEPPNGKKLFEARCAACHGLDAKGSSETAKRLGTDLVNLDLTREAVARKSAAALRALVSGRHGKMPRQESLKPAEIQALVKYLQSIQKTYVLKRDGSPGRIP